MAVETGVEQVQRALQMCGHECLIEEVMDLCPALTWNQVFLAVDHLSRIGQIQLQIDSTRSYRVKVLTRSSFRQDPASSVV